MKKTVTVILLSAFLLSGCTAAGPAADTDEIVAAASEISGLIVSRDEKRLEQRIDGRYQLISSSVVFDDDEPDEGTLQIRNAIADTMEYEVVEDSCEAVSATEGTIDVVFSYADYEALFADGSFSDADDAAVAVSSCDQRAEVTLNMHLVYKDDDWKLYNFDIISSCFPFEAEEFALAADIRDTIVSTCWDESSDGVYSNSPRLRYIISFDPEKTGDTVSYSYEISYEGEIIEESDLVTDNTPEEIVILYSCGQDGQDSLPAGTYSITVYDEAGNAIITDECTAEYEATWAEMTYCDVEELGLRFNLPSGFRFLAPNNYYYSYIFQDYDNMFFVASNSDYTVFIAASLYFDTKDFVDYDTLDSFVETMAELCTSDEEANGGYGGSSEYWVSRVDFAGRDLPALDRHYCSDDSDVETYDRYIYLPEEGGVYEITVLGMYEDDPAYYTENFWENIGE
ncbi:MAG: hypothetical protein IKT14_06940 [Clostridiales bacterium]|nr:hypothetical protein [Clostridiales bacterium]